MDIVRLKFTKLYLKFQLAVVVSNIFYHHYRVMNIGSNIYVQSLIYHTLY